MVDTHVLLWAISDDPRLSATGRSIILDVDNDIFVSAASFWEIAIKSSLGRTGPGAIQISGATALSAALEAGYELLPVSPAHAIAVERLPPLHSDPFDRLLVAQALTEPLILLTHDAAVAAYSDTIVRI